MRRRSIPFAARNSPLAHPMTSPDEGVSPALSRPGRWAFPFAGMGRATKAALVTFVLSAAVGAMVATLAEKQRVAERERAALAIAAEHASALQQQIYRSLSITDALAGEHQVVTDFLLG
ncbi:MAG TPA: hypothetical protein PLD37_14020, partial [Usitatibacteraceae bacterium]|nr:hypothetical protein [Usitatibacteraceae bacterium]